MTAAFQPNAFQPNAFQIGRAASGGTTFTSELTAGLSFAGALARRANKVLSGALSFAGRMFVSALPLRGVLSFSGAFVKRTNRALAGVLSFVGALNKRFPAVLAGVLSFVGAISSVRFSVKFLTGALSFAGSQAKFTSHVLTASLGFVGALGKLSSRALAGALSFAGSLARRAQAALAGTLSFSVAFTKRTFRALAAALSFVGDLLAELNPNVVFEHAMTAVLSFSAALGRGRFMSFVASLFMTAGDVGLKLPARFAEFFSRLFTWHEAGEARTHSWSLSQRSADFPQDGAQRGTRWTSITRRSPKSVV